MPSERWKAEAEYVLAGGSMAEATRRLDFLELLDRMADGWRRVAARPATGGSDGHGWGATAPDIDGDAVRYGVGG